MIFKQLNIAGVNGITVTVPFGEYWIIHSARVKFVADGTVATRYPRITLKDEQGDEFLDITHLTGATAGQTFYWNLYAHSSAHTTTGGYVSSGFPTGLLLQPSYKFQAAFISAVAGDTHSLALVYDRLLERTLLRI